MSRESQNRLPLAEMERENAAEWARTLEAMVSDLARELAAERDWDHAAQIRRQLREIEDGPSPAEGLTFPIMSGRMGLRRTSATMAKLDAEIAELRANNARWPTSETTNLYEYLGASGRATVGGRQLETGEIVGLTEIQAKSWADRFRASETERA
jgi:hypothetical protein